MCLIIYNPNGSPMKTEYLRLAYENNPDGFGIMYADNGRVIVNQGLFTLDVIKELIRECRGKPYAVHFRYKTRGKISAEMTHPFQVLSHEEDGEDLWMMHNGTFSFLKPEGDQSDTSLFAEKFKPIIRELGTDVLFDKYHPRRMGKKIGEMNKVLFMRGDGRVTVINSQQGFVENGKWYSNRYSLQPKYRANQAAGITMPSKVPGFGVNYIGKLQTRTV